MCLSDLSPRKAAGLLLSFVLSCPLPALAGWVVTEGQGEDRSLTYIQNNRIKYEDSEQATIFDLERGTMTVLQPRTKRYWTGSPQDFTLQMKAAVDAQLESELAGLPPEQRQALKEAAGISEAPHAPPATPAGPALAVQVQRTDQVDRVAGHAARKHQIWVEGRLVEEVWIAEDLDLARELDPAKFANLLAQAKGDDLGDWEFDPQVRQLRAKGLELKSVRHGATGPEEAGVVQRVEQKDLPAHIFEVPAGYERASMADIVQ